MKLLLWLPILASVCCVANTQLMDLEEAGPEEEEHVELFTTPTTKMAAATSDFGYNLFRALASRAPAANVFLAPSSISEALTQLSLGASDQAQRQLYRALRYHTLQDPQLHNTLRNLLASIKGPTKGLKTAARIYLARRLKVKPDFLAAVQQQYGTQPQPLSGTNKDVRDVNAWVKQQTGVERLLTRPLGRAAGLHLLGAAHFKGRWSTRFGQSGASESFQVDGGAAVRVPMMHQDNYPMKLGVDSDLSCTIGQLQMEGDVSMFVFLPDAVSNNLTLLEDSLTAEFVQDLSMTLQPAQVSLKLPVLKVSYSTDLLAVLPDLGLSDWLTDTNLVGVSAQPAKLLTVNHKVVMETAPEGSQYPGSSAHPSHLLFHVTRPFLYLLRDDTSGALMVVGRVLNPKGLRK